MTFNQWCKTMWLKWGLLISGWMLIFMVFNWNSWSTSLKCVTTIAALIPVHATEEWIFPGGFAFQYNTFLNKSKYPSCYPMNRASDMFTVLLTTIMYAIIALFFIFTKKAVPCGILLGATCFSALEVSVHTFFGIKAYLTFKDQGKTTIYGTGSITAYTGFLILGIIMIQEIMAVGITSQDILICIIILALTSVFVFVPEIIFKDKHSIYAYDNNGYYDKFIKK